MNLELIPLLIIVLLAISTGGADVETTEFVIEGDHEMTEHRGALIVGDATVTVPAGEVVSGPVYVIGGEFRVHGTVEGDVTQLSGSHSSPRTVQRSAENSSTSVGARNCPPKQPSRSGPLSRLNPLNPARSPRIRRSW